MAAILKTFAGLNFYTRTCFIDYYHISFKKSHQTLRPRSCRVNQNFDISWILDLGLNPKARDKVLNLIIECNLIDPWRELNLENMQYTWRKKNTRKQARLDFFLISESLFMDVTNSKILPGYRTDHSQILLQFDFGKFVKGNSYWKFNNSLLRDSKFIEEIKELIRQTILTMNYYREKEMNSKI